LLPSSFSFFPDLSLSSSGSALPLECSKPAIRLGEIDSFFSICTGTCTTQQNVQGKFAVGRKTWISNISLDIGAIGRVEPGLKRKILSAGDFVPKFPLGLGVDFLEGEKVVMINPSSPTPIG
jgi:hypothetical protein